MKKGSSDGGGPLCHCVTSPHTVGSHPQTPFLKLSVLIFPQIGRSPCIATWAFYYLASYLGKNKIKSLWKGVRGRTFPQKGFPRVTDIYQQISLTLIINLLYFSDLCRVVRSFLCDIDIVRMALLEACACNADELCLLVESRDIHTSAVAHT